MSRGPENVTSVTNTEPPAWLAAPMKSALNAATANYRQQVSDSYQLPDDGTVASPPARPGRPWRGPGGRDLIYDQRLVNGPGVVNGPSGVNGPGGAAPFGATTLIPNSQGLVNNTIMGDYLSPDSNPFLQGTFNRAADLTRGRLDSEFAGSGRNLGASMPARSEELQTLASNIYGGNYQAERDRQFNAVGQAESLDPLNQYFNRIAGIVPGAGGVTTSTQPVYKTGLF